MDFTYLSNATPAFFDQLYQSYKADPNSVSSDWKRFFEGFEFATQQYGETGEMVHTQVASKEVNVLNLINGYRERGHLFAKTNPILNRPNYQPDLGLAQFDLTEADLDTVFQAGKSVGLGAVSLREIVKMLEDTYCRTMGTEFMFLREPEMRNWLMNRLETDRAKPNYNDARKERILNKITQGVVLEDFIAKKFVGKKRFSLEGGETLIAALDGLIEKGTAMGIEEFVLGMAHRGRLNVLGNIMQKEYNEVFAEFKGAELEGYWAGDVKYHMGYSNNFPTADGRQVHLSLLPNPSHLETVNPVVQGVARAKIDKKYKSYNKLAPILIHGDAAVAGQGVVYEVIQMSLLEGYKTGGTIHFVINNQVGFTTLEKDARSSTYSTDVAKVTLSPVFHVNGDDPEQVLYAVELALEFRQKFNRDVFIEILCYRKHGHNEGDEPTLTQPLMYSIIKKHENPAKVYSAQLANEGKTQVLENVKTFEKQFRALLQSEYEESQVQKNIKGMVAFSGVWQGIRKATKEDFQGQIVPTGVAKEKLLALAAKLNSFPETFNANSKIATLVETRKKAIESDKLDWALGELLAYASLLSEGYPIRLSGQDVKRGTFSHRNAVFFDTKTEEEFTSLNHLEEGQANIEIYNSLLSEYGVLGFEYGYAYSNPNQLVIWEAQFGDFANGAQIIMDQFVASAEMKWQRMNNLVQLLPHGYEGQGPEHSSARIERYLELCANKNMQVCNITTPANLFHALRRQLHRDFRIPLVIFTPKKLLRFAECVSSLNDFTEGGFAEVIDDVKANPKKVKRVLFCTGKIYYDLLKKQQDTQNEEVAIVRLEQVYPLPIVQLQTITTKYSKATSHVWVQEEPRNMGAWAYILRMFEEVEIECICRKPSPSPATGYEKRHEKEQIEIVEKAFTFEASKKRGAVKMKA
ncbi:MAG: 2-oxoglutarate dehydrogenase E1 component [Bacteroidia bacterium]